MQLLLSPAKMYIFYVFLEATHLSASIGLDCLSSGHKSLQLTNHVVRCGGSQRSRLKLNTLFSSVQRFPPCLFNVKYLFLWCNKFFGVAYFRAP